MKTVVFCDGPLEHNHMRFASVPSEIRVQWHRRQYAIYRCTHHETKTGNVKYTCTDIKYGSKKLIEKR